VSRIGLLSLQLLVAVVVLGSWQLLATVPVFGHMLLPPFFFSNPLDVGSQIFDWFRTGMIWKHLLITLWESILAFAIGSLGGVGIGFWFARQPLVAAVFDPYVKMANALPRVVLAPIFTLWLGLGIWSKVALVEVLGAQGALDGYHLFHATRADLLRRLGRRADAARAYERALGLATNRAERAFLARRLAEARADG